VSVVKHQSRYIAEGVHASVVAAARNDLAMLIDFDGFLRKLRFVKNDVRQQRR
jgi:hypothetical protein